MILDPLDVQTSHTRSAGQTYPSLSEIARLITGTNWNGPRFFGLRQQKRPGSPGIVRVEKPRRGRPAARRHGDRLQPQAGGVS